MSYNFPEKTALWLDITDILNSPTIKTKMLMTATIHTPKEDIKVLKVMTMDTFRDYVKKVADNITISMKVAMGDYVYRIYPNRTKIEVSVRIVALKSVTQERVEEEIIFVDRYQTRFDQSVLPPIHMSDYENVDMQTLNAMDMVDLTLPLMDSAIVKSKVETVQGVHSGTVESVIKSVLQSGSSGVDGVEMVPSDNSESKNHIIFPESIHLTAVPTFLQQRMSGVYNEGIGNYLQRYKGKKNWYVYPLYKTDRFNQGGARVIFYGIPQDKYLEVENTYKESGSTLKIVVAGEKMFFDTSDIKYLESGAGFRRTKPDTYLKKPASVSGDTVTGMADSLNQDWDVDDKQNELKYKARSMVPISVNSYHERSRYAEKKAAQINFNWNNSRADLIHPGMPCKYVYLSPEGVSEYLGVILSVHQYVALQGNPASSNMYRATCGITAAISRYDTGLKATTAVVTRNQ